MHGDDVPEVHFLRVVLLTHHVCLALYALIVVRAVASVATPVLRGERSVRSIVGWLLELRAWLQKSNGTSEETDTKRLSAKAKEHVTARRVERTIAFCQHGLHIIALYATLCLFLFRYHAFSASFGTECATPFLPSSLLVDLTMGFVVGLYVHFLPQRIGPITIDVFHAVFMARVAWQGTPPAYVTGSTPRESIYLLYRLCCGALIGNPSVTALLNTALVAIRVYLYIRTSTEPAWDCNGDGYGKINVFMEYGDTSLALTMFVLTEMFCGVTAVLASWTFEYSTWKEGLAILQAKVATRAESTITALLSMLCDAVVPTTVDFTLTTPSEQLAGFLMRQPFNKTYEGSNLLDLLVEEDREDVAEQLASCLDAPGQTVSALARAIDGGGTLLSLRLYSTQFTDAEDRNGFMIGILDARREEGHVPTLCPPQCQADQDFDLPATRQHRTVEVASEASGGLYPAYTQEGAEQPPSDWYPYDKSSESSAATSSVGAASSHGSLPLFRDSEGASEVWVDFSQDNLPIVHASSAFESLMGPGREHFFKDWMEKQEVKLLRKRVYTVIKERRAARRAMPSGLPQDEDVKLATLKNCCFKPHLARKANFAYVVSGSASLVHADDPSSGAPIIVHIKLSSVNVRALKSDSKDKQAQRKKANALRKEERDKLNVRASGIRLAQL
eukprot:TRINITY_DN122713_c0_g1_i1.p1 TRINITY_DN122713_c0_g1~~TRINITY_DN122713_c0_g1_i1.p1  ORF type:complete len:673 (+),score=60.91 TRINITY_DN122713_c0_g1_i1:103-2121(+)